MASVTLRDICKSYDGTPITRHIDLDIEDGEFVVFVGPPAAASPPCCG